MLGVSKKVKVEYQNECKWILTNTNFDIKPSDTWYLRVFYENEAGEVNCYQNKIFSFKCIFCQRRVVFTAPYCSNCLRTYYHLEVKQTLQVDKNGRRLGMLGLFGWHPDRIREKNIPIFRAEEQDVIAPFISEVATMLKSANVKYSSDTKSNRYGRVKEGDTQVQTGGPYELTTNLKNGKTVQYDSGRLRSAASFANTIMYGEKKFNARFIEPDNGSYFPAICCTDNDVYHKEEILVDYSNNYSDLEHTTFYYKPKSATRSTRSLYRHFRKFQEIN